MAKRMIFHAPYQISENPKAASQLRPKMMLEAFKKLGYEVFEITGNTRQRRQKFAQLKKLLKKGETFDFLYCENSTSPNIIGGGVAQGFAPLLDYAIHRQAKKHHIPVGVFYRDVYWKYHDVTGASRTASKEKITPKKILYSIGMRGLDLCQWIDLRGYLTNQVHFFLPSTPMIKILDLNPNQCSVLPPGYGIEAKQWGEETPLANQSDQLRVFYVGALGGHYRFEQFWQAAQDTDTCLRVCIPEQNWQDQGERYTNLGLENTEVVHATADELETHYQWCNATMLVFEKNKYQSFATPVKLFEYLGHGKPVLVSAGTNAARIVEQYGAGWVTECDRQKIANLLNKLQRNPQEIVEKTLAARKAAQEITWVARAQQVVETLTEK